MSEKAAKASRFADKTIQKEPKNMDAWQVKVEAANQTGGTEEVKKVVKEARDKGLTAREIEIFAPRIAPLLRKD